MKLTIRRSDWLRGKGALGSALLTDTGKMCCLGFLALELGAKPEEILSVPTPAGCAHINWPEGFIEKFSDIIHNIGCQSLMEINDDCSLTDKDRENTLKDSFTRFGIEVEFVD